MNIPIKSIGPLDLLTAKLPGPPGNALIGTGELVVKLIPVMGLAYLGLHY